MEETEKPNILLVDDRPKNLVALENLLAEFDSNLVKATSGNQALELALKNEFALILMDVQMPEMDGFETAELLRHRIETPIIFVTALSKESQHIFKGYESGAVDYLMKPLDPLILKSKVGVFLNLYEQQRLLEKKNMELKDYQSRLEAKVEERTAELKRSNEILQQEMDERKRAEQERYRLEDKLRHAQKMKALGTLAGGVAHEFNNLLVPINGFTRRVRNKLNPESKEADYLDRVIKAAQRAKDLVAQVMIFSQKSQAHFEPLLLNNFVEEELKQLQASLPSTIGLQEKLSQENSLIKSDSAQIRLVLSHLCTNARDAMPEGGVVTVAVNQVALNHVVNFQGQPIWGSYVCLSVQDSGCGMEEGMLQRIFEPFFTTKGPDKGTGLGLSTVLGIVEQHGGDIRVESQPGKGTTFYIYLPTLPVKEAHPSMSTENTSTMNHRS